MKVYIIRGIPGSGKTTHAKKILHADIVIEADDFFTKGGKYKFNKRFSLAIADSKNKDKSIAACNTFSRRWEIAPYIEACKKAGVDYSVIRMDGTFDNVHDVPDYVVHNMSKRFENVAGEIVQRPVFL